MNHHLMLLNYIKKKNLKMYLFMMLQDQIFQLKLLKNYLKKLKKNNAVVPYIKNK